MNLRNIARNNYLKFSAFEGAQHIASEYAIYKLLEISKRFNVSSILEVGLGIGSISCAILANSTRENLSYIGTESNSFCLRSLRKNLDEKAYDSLTIVPSIDEVNTLERKFDLVIIDGKDNNILSLANQLKTNAIIAIEGHRLDQVNDLKTIFPKAKYVHAISSRKNDPKGNGIPGHWQGGIKLLFLNPNNYQLFYWSIEKIKTKLVYIYRKYLA